MTDVVVFGEELGGNSATVGLNSCTGDDDSIVLYDIVTCEVDNSLIDSITGQDYNTDHCQPTYSN